MLGSVEAALVTGGFFCVPFGVGNFFNKLLHWALVFKLTFAAAVIYLPPLQIIYRINAPGCASS